MSHILVLEAGQAGPVGVAVARGAIIHYLRSGRKRGPATFMYKGLCGTLYSQGPTTYLDLKGLLFSAEFVGYKGPRSKFLVGRDAENAPDVGESAVNLYLGDFPRPGVFRHDATVEVPIGVRDVQFSLPTVN